jgi:hypothetical protein
MSQKLDAAHPGCIPMRRMGTRSFQQAGTTLKMPSMTIYKFSAIILVPFPFTDQTII